MLQRPSRNLWIAALALSLLAVAGLAYALITDWNAAPDRALHPPHGASSGSGFTIGLVIGLGAGVVIGSLIALRKKSG